MKVPLEKEAVEAGRFKNWRNESPHFRAVKMGNRRNAALLTAITCGGIILSKKFLWTNSDETIRRPIGEPPSDQTQSKASTPS